MDKRRFYNVILKQVVAGGAALLAVGLLMDFHALPSLGSRRSVRESCQRLVQSQAKLSKAQLTRLLTVPEGDRKQKVREILRDPYCELSSLQIRVGVPAQREAYPLEFDPQTWLVVLYEGDQYAGYRISDR
ncbi:hypothetical protein [Leptothermofonsia sp. ETS-13]|uniref:hypothetical protein n=1 Tax=Leptothermofonsia sp. ETS-13 TaxID=3035696 RepID=UPI003B9FF1C5